ncbi:MAG TPA: rod shape-determining protein MreC [Candidatus Dormibacteraeota bacterium]|nr:rod shape-determining protein MreC [Candidatus Dormibacteraeota bacterium]
MSVSPSRRPLLFLAAAVAAQLLLLAFQIQRNHHIRLIQVWAADVFTPAGRAGTSSIDWIGALWSGYIDLQNTRARNRHLQAEVDQLQLQVDRLRGRAAEGDRLAALLAFRQSNPALPLLAARVIGASLAPASKVLYIDRGARDGVHRDMAVITPNGVVGKILESFPSSSQVLLVTDRQSGVGALLSGSRVEGVVKGTDGPDLRMDYVEDGEKIKPGETVLTSGLDQIFPKDLPVGTVLASRPANPFQKIEVRPAAQLDRLEDVLVVLLHPKPLPPSTAGDSGAGSHR